jgi:amino-acid N-acetyltransferase
MMSGVKPNFLAFRPAATDDWAAIEALLTDARLPLDGAQIHLASFIVGEVDGAIVSAGALEHYGDVALLRSVVVSADRRGSAVGSLMYDELLATAKARGIEKLFLLTTTAAPFFARRGFAQEARAAAPTALQASREFQGACPASATLMSLSLN